MLEIKNIKKSFGKLKALDGLDMKVEKGSLFGFIGPNGAGKTTTMKIISGILRPDSGDIYINDSEINGNVSLLKSKIGYMPDFFGVYDNLTVFEYMEFFASLYNIDKYDALIRIDELLELVRLLDYKLELVDGLSRGMKQRLCLARTMLHAPEMLILDEPASGMEPAARIELKHMLKQLSEEGTTIIISSHVLSELSELCGNIGIIIKGRMILQGTKEEVIMKQKSLQPMIIKVAEEAETAMRIFRSHPLASKIAIEAGRNDTADIYSISLQFMGKEEDEIGLLNKLIYAGVKVLAYKREEGDLESIFMELTKV